MTIRAKATVYVKFRNSKFRNWRIFEFFHLLKRNIVKRTLKIRLFIDINWMFKNLNWFIGLTKTDNLVLFKF